MKENRLQYPVKIMCRVLEVSCSGYYAFLKRDNSNRRKEDARIKTEIMKIHIRSHETYGPLRIKPALEKEGIHIGIGRIIRLRKELGIRCKQKKKFKATTNSKHNYPVFPNLLEEKYIPPGPNQVWHADITYVPTEEGWLYLAGIRDAYSCEIVGFSMDKRMKTDLVIQALYNAVKRKNPPKGVIHHSDRGSQYCSHKFRKLLGKLDFRGSMGRKGNCYDNPVIESFWGTLKKELVHHKKYKTREEAKSEITQYIELFYNRQRLHSRLGYLSPVEFLQKECELGKAA